jgi:hypothetical protein
VYEEIKMNEDKKIKALQERTHRLEQSNSVNFWGFLLHTVKDVGFSWGIT